MTALCVFCPVASFCFLRRQTVPSATVLHSAEAHKRDQPNNTDCSILSRRKGCETDMAAIL